MRRAIIFMMLLCGALLASTADAQAALSGTWLMQNRKAEVDIAPCGGGLCGRISRIIVYPKDGARTDIHNRNAALRNRPLAGMPVLLDFRQSGGSWRGRAYDPKSGGIYATTLTQTAPNRMTLTACVLFICKSQEWTRLR